MTTETGLLFDTDDYTDRPSPTGYEVFPKTPPVSLAEPIATPKRESLTFLPTSTRTKSKRIEVVQNG